VREHSIGINGRKLADWDAFSGCLRRAYGRWLRRAATNERGESDQD